MSRHRTPESWNGLRTGDGSASVSALRSSRQDRDRCPGILALHSAEDGWLARIRLTGGRIAPEQLDAVAQCACAGNGLVDITVRANLQVRGLAPDAGEEAAAMLGAVGLLPSLTHERARNMLASPVAGRHPLAVAPTDELITELDDSLCGDPVLAGLPGRFLFGIDDGSGLLQREDLDVGLFAEHDGADEERYRLVVGGARTTALAAREDAIGLALDAARAFLALAASEENRVWRIRDLSAGGSAVAVGLGVQLDTGASVVADAPILVVGRLEQKDGSTAVTALPPLGRLDVTSLRSLARVAREIGSDVRVSPWRTLTIVDVPTDRVGEVVGELQAIGLQVEPNGWQLLSACAGLGACEKARVDVRAAAEQRARSRSAASLVEHWSACERRCGTPRSTAVSIYAVSDRVVIEDRDGRHEVADAEEAVSLLAERTRR